MRLFKVFMVCFCHVKKGDRVIVISGRFRKVIGNIVQVVRVADSKNRFQVALDSIKTMRKKKKGANSYTEKSVFIDSSNVTLLKIENS